MEGTNDDRLDVIVQAIATDTSALERGAHFHPAEPGELKEVFKSLRAQGLEPSKRLQNFYKSHNPIDVCTTPWLAGELELVPLRELADIHDGYAWDNKGKRSDIWRGHWIIIALAGDDPYFVHTGHNTLPVYTDTHGMGAWQPTLVSNSLEQFLAILHQWYAHFVARGVDPDIASYAEKDDQYGKARCERSWNELLDSVKRIDPEALPFWEDQRPGGLSKLHHL